VQLLQMMMMMMMMMRMRIMMMKMIMMTEKSECQQSEIESWLEQKKKSL